METPKTARREGAPEGAGVRQVRVCAYDAAWPSRYEREAADVMDALGCLAVEVAHIGSTSVPGLAAKPTVDILVGVRSLDVVDAAMGPLAQLGYEYRGEMGVPGRRYFRKGAAYPRDFNLHLVVWGDPLWVDYLAFRDFLRAQPDQAQRYVDVKRRLLSTPTGADPSAYGEGKSAFIAQTLQQARAWREARRSETSGGG